jgi:Bacterial archaeo-eukaryotic release factor family 3
MNRKDIQQLQSIREYPSVSLFLPIYRKSPEDQSQTPVRVKNLVREAEDRLLAEFSQRDVQSLLDRLAELAQSIDYDHPHDGLALFANKDFSRFFHLPVQVEERVVINGTFATRALVLALNRDTRYWVLVLTERLTRLYRGSREKLEEVTNGDFPLPLEMPGVVTESPSNFGVEQSARRNSDDRHYFVRVDKALGEVLKRENLPLAIVGIERDLAAFKDASKNTGRIIATVSGRHQETPAHALWELVWPQVEAGLAAQRKGILQSLDTATGAKRFAAGIADAWRLAHEGRVDTLVVEEGFHYPAQRSEDGRQLTVARDAATPVVTEDAVDTIIETVLDKSGEVAFMEDGTLQEHGRIAMILRY